MANETEKKVKVLLYRNKSYQVKDENLTGEIEVTAAEAKRLVEVLKIGQYSKK